MPVPYIFWLYDRGYHRDWAFLAALIVMGSYFFALEVPIRRIDARRHQVRYTACNLPVSVTTRRSIMVGGAQKTVSY